MPRELQTHIRVEVTQARGVSLRGARDLCTHGNLRKG